MEPITMLILAATIPFTLSSIEQGSQTIATTQEPLTLPIPLWEIVLVIFLISVVVVPVMALAYNFFDLREEV